MTAMSDEASHKVAAAVAGAVQARLDCAARDLERVAVLIEGTGTSVLSEIEAGSVSQFRARLAQIESRLYQERDQR